MLRTRLREVGPSGCYGCNEDPFEELRNQHATGAEEAKSAVT
jgi:hypothetical protein